jgi:TRAP-type C4-dicarboxylate transport system permease small subunit
MRKVLDAFFNVCLVVAATAMVVIAIAVLAQVFGRLLGILVPAAPEIAGYAMATSSFMALAYTFRSGGHIRVGLLISNLSASARLVVEIGVLAAVLALAAYFLVYLGMMTVETYELQEVSSGVLAIPLWIPQTFLTVGVFALVLAIAEQFFNAVRGEMPAYADKDGQGH